MDQHYKAAIKVLGGLVIPKERSQWQKHTEPYADIVTYGLIGFWGSFGEKYKICIIGSEIMLM